MCWRPVGLLFSVVLCSVLCPSHTFGGVGPPGYDVPDLYRVPSTVGVCQRTWRPVLKLDNAGNVVMGSIKEVKFLSLKAQAFRIKLYLQDGPYLLNVDNTNVREHHLCAESIWHVSDNGTHISTDVEWRYHMVCTDGQVHIMTSPYSRPLGWKIRTDADPVTIERDALLNFGYVDNITYSMVWYVKEIDSGEPVLSHYLDGSTHSGGIDDLIYMARLGETRCVMRDRGYSFTMNNVIIDVKKRLVNGQSLSHIGQLFAGDHLVFNTPPYYWYSSWSTDGRRDCTRWYVGTTQHRLHNNDFVASDWHVDGCWREVYTNDRWGYLQSGSLDELIFLISLGHRVRMHYGNTVLEANSIRIKEHTVIAQCIEEMARRKNGKYDDNFFNTETMWQWTTLHTTGTIKTYTYRVKDMSFYKKDTFMTSIRWMVDTRSWHRVFSTPGSAYSTVTVDTLVNAVNRGAAIRFNLQQDVQAGFFFTNADNVRVDEATLTVYAQCLRHISDERDQLTLSEYDIQKNPFHWFLMISSDGVMAMSAWKTQARTMLYNSVAPEANITWFASY